MASIIARAKTIAIWLVLGAQQLLMPAIDPGECFQPLYTSRLDNSTNFPGFSDFFLLFFELPFLLS